MMEVPLPSKNREWAAQNYGEWHKNIRNAQKHWEWVAQRHQECTETLGIGGTKTSAMAQKHQDWHRTIGNGPKITKNGTEPLGISRSAAGTARCQLGIAVLGAAPFSCPRIWGQGGCSRHPKPPNQGKATPLSPVGQQITAPTQTIPSFPSGKPQGNHQQPQLFPGHPLALCSRRF